MRITLEPALVLRKHDYSETSQILRLIARDTGVIGVLAKGTKKPKSSFGGALDLFYLGAARIIHRPRSGLAILGGFSVQSAYPGLRKEMFRFYAACHLAEILIGMTREEEPQARLFDLVSDGLFRIEAAGSREIAPVLIAVELNVLRELGFAPELDRCAACGRSPARGRAALSFKMGGLLCSDCRDQDPTRIAVAPGTLSALRNLSRSPPERATRLRLSGEDVRRIRDFLTEFEEWRLERALRTARHL